MSKLAVFRENLPCPKCGEVPGPITRIEWVDAQVARPKRWGWEAVPARPEFLVQWCVRCKHGARYAPLDSATEEPI